MTTATQTLTAFLLARIAEDEAVAREVLAQQQHDVTRSPGDFPSGYDPAQDFDLAGADGPIGYTVVMIGVARVLADCEAKRRIVEAFEDERGGRDIYNRDYDSGDYDFNENDLRARLASNAHCRGLEIALRALASVYPDYRDEWRA